MELVSNLQIKDILSLCQSNKYLNEILCDNDDFWRIKYLHDIGEPFEDINKEGKSWKDIYKDIIRNKVFMFGHNNSGQLGLEDMVNRSVPTQIPEIKSKYISCGSYHTAIIDINNNVLMFGGNLFGMLGLGDVGGAPYKDKPNQIQGIKASHISCGSYHTAIIDINDNVLMFGHNNKSQLGLGDSNNRNIPIPIPGIKAKYVSCGGNHTAIIDLNNNIFMFGWNKNGQLGLGDVAKRNKPTQIPGIKAKYVSCGGVHTAIIDLNDNVFMFGKNYDGQLGLGHEMDVAKRNKPTQIPGIKAKYVSCGDAHTAIIDINDNVLMFGNNHWGQLGLCGGINRNKPTQITIPTAFTTPTTRAKYISCGEFHTAIIDINDKIFMFGDNNNGQLGLGDVGMNRRNIPTQILGIKAKSVFCGGSHTAIIV